MKYIVILLMLIIAVPAFAGEQVYVDKDAAITEKTSSAAFVVTKEMKTAALALGDITVMRVKYEVAGVGNRSEAKQVIAEMLDAETIKTKSERYAELYPSVMEIQ